MTYDSRGTALPPGWRTAALRRVAICRDDLRAPVNAEQRARRPGEIPYWGANSVQGTIDRALVDQPVVLLGEDGAPFFEADRPVAFYVDEPIWPNNHIHVLVPRPEISGKWLTHALNAVDYSLVITGSTRDKLTQGAMLSISLPVPPHDEQQAIADFLAEQMSRIDTLIDKQSQLITTLHERRSAVISRTVTRGIRVNADLVESGVESLGSVPSHWRVCRMKHLGRATIGLTYTPAELVGPDDRGTLVLRSGNIQEGQIALLDNVYVSAAIPKELRIVRGDIVVCSRNGSARLIGKNAVATDDVIGQTWGAFMTVVRSNYSRYLHWILNSQVFASQTGTFATATINQLTTTTFHNLVVALPPRDERDEIVMYLDEQTSRIDALIAKTQTHITLAKERRAALITAAVTGQIDVRTAGRLVAGVA